MAKQYAIPATIGSATFPALPGVGNGTWLQIYLGSLPKGKDGLPSLRAIENRLMPAVRSLGLPGILFHAGPRHLEKHVGRYARFGRDAGVPFGFAFGLDGEQDTDGTRLTVEEKGTIMGGVAAGGWGSSLIVPNAEIAYDADTGPEDDMDEAGVLRMGQRLRALAPSAVVIDQPWFAIDSHGEERREAKPLGQGGTFAGFPSDEFASWCDARAPQAYFRNFGIADPMAWRRVMLWQERDWAKHDVSLARLNLVRPRTCTLQMYGHHRRPQDFVHVLLILRDRVTIGWWDHEYYSKSEQWRVTVACMAAAKAIIDGGHAPAGRSPSDAIRSWQTALGFTGADVDGWVGFGTLKRAWLF